MAVGMDFVAAHQDWPVLVPGYGGCWGPKAIAEVLFGDFSPSGRLPYTIYPERWAVETPMTSMELTAGLGRAHTWYGVHGDTPPPSFPFGAGLGYSTFQCRIAEVDFEDKAHARQPLAAFNISFRNMGAVASAHTVIAFAVSGNVSARAPRPLPLEMLVGWVKSPTLESREEFTDEVEVNLSDIAITTESGITVAYAGTWFILFNDGSEVLANYTLEVAADVELDALPLPE